MCSMLADDMYVKFKIRYTKRVNRTLSILGRLYNVCTLYVGCIWSYWLCSMLADMYVEFKIHYAKRVCLSTALQPNATLLFNQHSTEDQKYICLQDFFESSKTTYCLLDAMTSLCTMHSDCYCIYF